MPQRANAGRRYVIQLALVALVLIGMTLYCLYDGLVAYPKLQEQGLVFQKLAEEERQHEWETIAKEKGWPPEYDPKTMKNEYDIYGQFVMAALAAVPGLLFLFFFLRARKRWVESDETGLQGSWGQRVEFDQIIELDKAKWRSKGIARIAYDDDNGARKKFVLDDFKFDMEPIGEMLRQVESYLDDDQIVNGEPERPPGEEHQPEDELDDDTELDQEQEDDPYVAPEDEAKHSN